MKKYIQSHFIVVLLLSCATGRGQTFLRYADSLRERHQIPALAYAVVTSDTVFVLEITGRRKHGETAPAGKNDRFHLGSNTKAITSYIAGKLVEENKIQWESRILDIFPEWENSCREEYQKVTLSKLLSHRAGLPAFTSGSDFKKVPAFGGNIIEQRRAFSKWLLEKKSLPQDSFLYSNAGYAIAAAMLERVSGKSWEDLVLEYLRKDLRIQPAFCWPALSDSAQPTGHCHRNFLIAKKMICPETKGYKLNPLVAPAGDINMKPADYAKFIQANLKALKGKKGVLSSSTINYIHYGVPDYAMGWSFVKTGNDTLSFHDGSAGTFYCHTIFSKKFDMAVIIMANCGDEEIIQPLYAFREALFSEYIPFQIGLH